MSPDEDKILARLIQWGEGREDVRAMVLTSTRTVPGATIDRLSDYDVIVAVSAPPGIAPFFASRDWLEAFGHVLVLYRDPILPWFEPQVAAGRLVQEPGSDIADEGEFVDEKICYVTQYEEQGLKIDFTVMPAGLLRRIARLPLSEDLDLGYRVLLDKDGLTAGMAPPTHSAYIPSPPSQAEYLECVEIFFHECTYLAKYLWRDDLVPAKAQLEVEMETHQLGRMLGWKAEIEAGWTLRLKPYGRELKRIMPPELWAELESLYVGPGIEENWIAMWRAIDLFARVAREVGAALGYPYPEDMHRRCERYFQWVQALPRAP